MIYWLLLRQIAILYMSSQRVKLTKSFIDQLELKPAIYRDSELIGFAVRVNNNYKTYIVEKKVLGKAIRSTLGLDENITLAQARELAREQLFLMSQGINPNNEKKKKLSKEKNCTNSEKPKPTVKEAFDKYFDLKSLKPRSIKDYTIVRDKYLEDWKNIKLDEVSRKMIQEKHINLSKNSKAQADMAMRVLRAIYNFSVEYYLDDNRHPILPTDNPVKTLNAKKAWNKIKRRKGYIRKDQIHDWVHTVLSTEWVGQNYYNHNAYTNQDFLLIVLLTGFRREETESLKWQDVDLKYGTVTSVDPKNGEPITLPMGPILKHIMQARFERSGGKPYVFQARQGDGHVTNRSKARYKITELSGIEFTYHDLRRTFSSIANSINISPDEIKKLINHSLDEIDITDAHTQVSFEDLHLAMMKIEQAVFTDQHFDMIKNRKFKAPTRHHDYLEKATSLKLEENSLSAISKVDQLKVLMNPLENHTKQK